MNQQGYTLLILRLNIIKVIQMRLERMTDSLEGCCSIQLSYWTLLRKALQR